MNDEITRTNEALAQCEAVIERGMQSFLAVGRALLKIRDERLYRANHATFEDYCRSRWKWSKTHVNRQIEAAGVIDNLTPIGVIPKTESQTRELVSLSPDQQRQAWATAITLAANGKQPTARQIAAIVGEMYTPRPSPTEARRIAIETGESVLDSKGWYQPPITEEEEDAFHEPLDLLDLILGFPESPLLIYRPDELLAKFAALDWPLKSNLRQISLDSFINWLKEFEDERKKLYR